ncbi:ThiF family adenylyltransferase [Patescibacteria group bacterium]
MKIKIIGIGGIGCCLLTSLARFANFKLSNTTITLIDGDDFEVKNKERQVFHRLGNKAEVNVEMLQSQFKRIIFNAIPEYLTQKNIVDYVLEDEIIFMGVDNHATRKLISDHCRTLNNIVLFSGGNELTDGNLQIFIRKEGENITLPIDNEFHPEIQYPKDKNPGELGCDELIESVPQLLFTNNMVASIMMNAFFAYLEEKLNYDEVYFDIITNMVRAISRTSETRSD